MTNLEFAQGLRGVADFYEQNPEAIQPYPFLLANAYERKQYIEMLKMMAHGGRVEKTEDVALTKCDAICSEVSRVQA
jgi:hypothetical protein